MRGDTVLLELVVGDGSGDSLPVRIGFRGEMGIDAVPSGGWFWECEIADGVCRGEGATVEEAESAMMASLRGGAKS